MNKPISFPITGLILVVLTLATSGFGLGKEPVSAGLFAEV